MKKETEKILLNELELYPYGNDGKYEIDRLFKIYTETEIEKLSDIFDESKQRDFKNFIIENTHLMRGLKKDENGNILEEEIRYARTLAHKKTYPLAFLTIRFFKDNRQEQEDFVKLVEHIAGKQKTKILDVGSGQIPYSSILLANDNVGDISSMDKFGISNKSLENMKVTPYDEYFTEKTPVKDYELVVANKACSAIPHIVATCANKKVGYLVKLCPCEAPGHKIEGWKEYLPTLDEKIKFDKNDYAFNLDL